MWSVKSLLLKVFQLLLLLLFFYQSYTIRKKYLRRDVQVMFIDTKVWYTVCNNILFFVRCSSTSPD